MKENKLIFRAPSNAPSSGLGGFIDPSVLQIASTILTSGEKPKELKASNEKRGILHRLGLGKSPKAQKEAKEVATESKKERVSFLNEASKSILIRHFPRLSAYLDIIGPVADKLGISQRVLGTTIKNPETHPLENEIETITAIMFILPGNEWKKTFTDPIANSFIFQKMVKHYPFVDGVPGVKSVTNVINPAHLPLLKSLGFEDYSELRKKVQEKDPNAVILFLRIMHQDMIAGKEGAKKVYGALSGAGQGILTKTIMDNISKMGRS